MTAVARCAVSLTGPTVRAALDRLRAPVIHARTAPYAGFPSSQQAALIRRGAERVLTLAGPGDVVLLPAEPDAAFVALLAELGIGPDASRIVVPEGSPDDPLLPRLLADARARARIAALLPGPRPAWFAPAMACDEDAPLAAALMAARRAPVRVLGPSLKLMARVDRKHVVRQAALALGVPVAEGQVVRLERDAEGRPVSLAPLDQAIRSVARRTGRAIVRGARGSGGSAVTVAGLDGLDGAAGEAFAAKPLQGVYLVEEYLPVLASPNVQVFIHPGTGTASCVSIADQLLSPTLGYRGNVYPSAAETAPAMVEASLRMARWLSRLGYRGLLGLDFIEVPAAGGDTRWLLAEINPRMNGSCQMMAMLERLNRGRAEARRPEIAAAAGGVLPTPARTVADLLHRLGGRRYDPASGTGVLPFHTAGLPDGQCGLAAFAHSREDALALFESVEAEAKDAPHAG